MSEIWTGHSSESLNSHFPNYLLDNSETRDWNHLQMTHALTVDADCCLRPELGLFAGTPTYVAWSPHNMVTGSKDECPQIEGRSCMLF